MIESDPPKAPGVPNLALAWALVFVLECLVALNALWVGPPTGPLVWIWIALVPKLLLVSPGRFAGRTANAVPSLWPTSLALGAVLGEAVGAFIAVPWALTHLCALHNRYNVLLVLFIRFFAVLLAFWAWRAETRSRAGQAGLSWRTEGVALLFGAATMLLFAVARWDDGREFLGHRPRMEVLAEQKAKEQLGSAYADYSLFERRLDPVFRKGESVTWRASMIAYSTDYRDVIDVDVSWTEPWDRSD